MEKPSTFNNNLLPHQNRELEIVGGIKNALERGEPMPRIKQSFLNAGYNLAEVNAAIQRLSSQTQIFQQEQSSKQLLATQLKEKKSFFSKLNIFSQFKRKKQSIPAIPSKAESVPSIQQYQQPKQLSRTWVIVMIIISALILIGAAILGLYWDKLFP